MTELALVFVMLMMLACAVGMGAVALMAWRRDAIAGVTTPERTLIRGGLLDG